MLYQIDSGYYCAGFITKDNKVISSAPIIKWMIGKDISYIINYCTYKNFNLCRIV